MLELSRRLSSLLLPLALQFLVPLKVKEEVVALRYNVCDPDCPLDKCDDFSEEESDKVCAFIIEYDPDGEKVEFPNICSFNCANKCFEYQLTAVAGPCQVNRKPASGDEPGSEEAKDLLPVLDDADEDDPDDPDDDEDD